jgi:hypothetical protein
VPVPAAEVPISTGVSAGRLKHRVLEYNFLYTTYKHSGLYAVRYSRARPLARRPVPVPAAEVPISTGVSAGRLKHKVLEYNFLSTTYKPSGLNAARYSRALMRRPVAVAAVEVPISTEASAGSCKYNLLVYSTQHIQHNGNMLGDIL